MNDLMIFYKSYLDAVKLIEDPAAQNEALLAILEYGIDGKVPEKFDHSAAQIVFTMARPQIDANIKRRSDGAKGGRPKAENPTFENEKRVVSETEKGGFSESEKEGFAKSETNNKKNNKNKDKEKDKEEGKKEDNARAREETFNDPALEAKWQEWLEYRKEIKKPYKSEKSVTQAAENLKKLAGFGTSRDAPQRAIEIINQSIGNGWQGLFAVKNETARSGTTRSFRNDTAEAIGASLDMMQDWLREREENAT